jgi:hypothetical protein
LSLRRPMMVTVSLLWPDSHPFVDDPLDKQTILCHSCEEHNNN